MAVSPDVLFSPRLKVERAYRHIDELIQLSSPLSRNFYTLRVERNVGPNPGSIARYGLVYRPAKPIPETFALIIGDALHNLRSALDHLATGIVRTADRKAEIHFPMRKTRDDFVSHPVITRIEKALPGAAILLADEVRAEGHANDALWSFHALENDDKHNLLIPTVTVAGVSNINARSAGIAMENCGSRGDATKPIYILGSGDPIAVDQNFKTSVEIRFGPGKAFENDPVIPTLTQIAEIVTETLNAFERLIIGRP